MASLDNSMMVLTKGGETQPTKKQLKTEVIAKKTSLARR